MCEVSGGHALNDLIDKARGLSDDWEYAAAQGDVHATRMARWLDQHPAGPSDAMSAVDCPREHLLAFEALDDQARRAG